ncbi:flagellar motor protein MotA [Enterovibrio norvegicus FF-33]|uniref:MotA/TolQ/ExbB proton channel family protein n=1 Tax=Enterovibrio TaxID=188143 RepID=UPI000303B335|nr:MotA/TolQ/ExbB proton channel family protein [Enterovibrio norvegicus]OEE66367.1 flagellar motor protein MotA [Enterovibrio norvegicus FF-33]
MKMKNLLPNLLLALLMSGVSLPVLSDLVDKSQAAHIEGKAHNRERESAFQEQEAALKNQLTALQTQQETLERETETLSDNFTTNEKTLSDLEQTLHLETGSLGEVFGVVRQVGRELQQGRVDSPVSASQSDLAREYNRTLDDIADAKVLPSLSKLNALFVGMSNDLVASGEIAPVQVNVRDVSGAIHEKSVQRLGNIGLVGQDGYLEWDGVRQQANLLPYQPNGGLTNATLRQTKAGEFVTIDPTRGEVLNQLSNMPTLSQRFQQAGVVGKIIAGLLTVGLGIALVRGVVLLRTRLMIRAQIKHPETAGNNPLGRVLTVYHSEPNRSLDSLELRLMETIMDEQQGFEKGLSMLKLLAAIAPMLGLLGTVTGMIETFQVITQFGNSDPTVMAGGISMALVTTVMGLVAAMPLLLAHNMLTTQAEMLRGTLEKIGVSLVAQQSEVSIPTSVVELRA